MIGWVVKSATFSDFLTLFGPFWCQMACYVGPHVIGPEGGNDGKVPKQWFLDHFSVHFLIQRWLKITSDLRSDLRHPENHCFTGFDRLAQGPL